MGVPIYDERDEECVTILKLTPSPAAGPARQQMGGSHRRAPDPQGRRYHGAVHRREGYMGIHVRPRQGPRRSEPCPVWRHVEGMGTYPDGALSPIGTELTSTPPRARGGWQRELFSCWLPITLLS